MATFKYSAFDDKEKKISGYVNAADQVEALSVLHRGLNPLSIRESEKKSNIKISTKIYLYLQSKCQHYWQQEHL